MKVKYYSRNVYEFKYFDNGKEDLCVIFPPAGVKAKHLKKFIKLLLQRFSVLWVNEGYFGISRLTSEEDVGKFEVGWVEKELLDQLKDIKCKNLLVIGGSVGALHALYFVNKIKRKNKLVLISPALYKRNFSTRLHKYLLEKAFSKKDFLESRTFKWPMKAPVLKRVRKEMLKVEKIVGARSYLFCLEDVMYFQERTQFNIEKYIKNSLVITGKYDPFIRLCDRRLLRKGKHIILNSGHSPMKSNPKKTAKLIVEFFKKS